MHTQVILSYTSSRLINNLCGPVEPEKTIKMLWKKLSNRNNDILSYNFPGSSLVLASTEEFLQSQTCYFKSSSNYNFTCTVDTRQQTSISTCPMFKAHVFISIKCDNRQLVLLKNQTYCSRCNE